MSKLIDLSHSIADGKVTYPGIPAPIICDFLSREASKAHYEKGVSFCINQIDMPANTGTYIDSPFHRYAQGADLASMPLESVAHASTSNAISLVANWLVGVKFPFRGPPIIPWVSMPSWYD